MRAYASAAVESELESLRSTHSGRAAAAFRCAAAIGSLVAAGEIDYTNAEARLLAAAADTDLPPAEALRNVRNGLRRGMQSPRQIPETGAPRPLTTLPVRQLSPPSEILRRPPVQEVEVLWESAGPVTADSEAVQWFCHRYRDSAPRMLQLAETWDLVRVLAFSPLPRWAASRGGSWQSSGHRLLFPLWDAHGQFSSVRARAIRPGIEPKSLAPAGFQVKGLVLADPLAVQVIGGTVPEWWQPEFVISEGEPDWLTWAARQSEAHEDGPAYIGVEAGAWSEALAARVPEGSRIVIRTDHDSPGERYAAQIQETLGARCHLYRSVADTGVAA